MRRRFSLAVLVVFVLIAVVVSARHRTSSRVAARVVASRAARGDTLRRLDSATRSDASAAADTMCFASRVGLPCDPR